MCYNDDDWRRGGRATLNRTLVIPSFIQRGSEVRFLIQPVSALYFVFLSSRCLASYLSVLCLLSICTVSSCLSVLCLLSSCTVSSCLSVLCLRVYLYCVFVSTCTVSSCLPVLCLRVYLYCVFVSTYILSFLLYFVFLSVLCIRK